MRILATADVHIYPHLAKSKIIDGVPSRLFLFKDLAFIIADIAKSYKVDCTVIAGDLSHIHQVDGVIGSTIQEFIDILLEVGSVFVIDGNHDVNIRYASKNAQVDTSVLYPLLARFSDDSDFYYNQPFDCLVPYSYLDILSYGLDGYKEKLGRYCDDLSSKIFVSHAFVSSAKLPSGLKISSGFDLEELSKTFRFSVIGDIHNGQLLGNVLIPGTPIQHTEKDSPVTGVWVFDTDNPKPEFISIDDEKFPRFIPKSRRVSKKDDSELVLDTLPGNDINSLVFDELYSAIKALKKDAKAKKRLVSYLDSIKDELSKKVSRKYAYLDIRSIFIDAFGCLTDKEFCFDESPVVVVGHNGTGKSTLCETVSWVLFNKSPSRIYLDDVINEELSYAKVTLVCNVLGKPFYLMRCRGFKDLANGLYISDDGENWVLKRDDFIKEFFGFDFDLFLAFYYHYQDKVSLLNKKNVDLLIDLFGLIYDFDVLDILKSKIDKTVSSLTSEKNVLLGRIEQIEEIIHKNKEDYDSSEAADIDINNLENEITSLGNSLREWKEAKAALQVRLTGLKQKIRKAIEAKKLLEKIPGVDACKSCSLVKHAYVEIEKKPVDEELLTIEDLINEQTKEIQKLEALIEEKREALINARASKTANIQLDDLEEKLKEYRHNLEVIEQKVDDFKVLQKIVGKKGISSILAAKVLNGLDIETEVVSVTFEPIKTKTGTLKGGIEPIVELKRKDKVVSYSRLSGGEKLLVDFTVLVRVLEYVKSKNIGFNLLVIDEGSKFLDELYSDSLFNLLNESELDILLVTHLVEFAKKFNKVKVLGS